MDHKSCICSSLLLLISLVAVPSRGVDAIGVCYGMLGSSLSQPSDVVALYKSNKIGGMRIYDPNQSVLQALHGSNIQVMVSVKIGGMRIYDPNQSVLQALHGSNIQVMVSVPNDKVQSLAAGASAARDWVQRNIASFFPSVSIRYIAVGNEMIPESPSLAQYVLPAMQNIQSAISSAGLQNKIKVSTAVSVRVLANSFPPSAGAFTAQNFISPIVQFLAKSGAPLLLNVYPYFSYRDNQAQISLPYALFTASGVVVQDGQYNYQNLFDALVDAVYAALEKVGGSSVRIVVSESGWPSAGDTAATIDNARTYNQNLIRHVGQGTPKRSGRAIEAYIFAMFDENQKSGDETEKHFGLFNSNGQPKYPISFN